MKRSRGTGRRVIHRDEVHKDIHLDPLAVALLDSEPLQRLGRVYQLGFAHLVYRGATHTRLSHCLGAYHVAGQIVDHLKNNYAVDEGDWPRGSVPPNEFLPRGNKAGESERWAALRHLVSWAALLHDVGHVPFGHTLEDEFEGFFHKHDDFGSPRIAHFWFDGAGTRSELARIFLEATLPPCLSELGYTGESTFLSVRLICLFKEKKLKRLSFRDLLGETRSAGPIATELLGNLQRVAGKSFFPYQADIVSNTISADFLDYLRRDARNAGLDEPRDQRLLSRFYVGKDAQAQSRMALSLVDRRGKPRLDTCTGVVDLVRRRYRHAEIVYYHKTKIAASAMLAKALRLLGGVRETSATRRPSETVSSLVASAFSRPVTERATRLAALRSTFLPSALCDTELGDETFMLLMLQQAWDALLASSEAPQAQELAKAIDLLLGVFRRALYKPVCILDVNSCLSLFPGEQVNAPEKLNAAIKDLRDPATGRAAKIEQSASSAAGWKSGDVLLYVPPKKAQAKGVDTYALAGSGELLTLESHFAVKEHIAKLNAEYEQLWRLFVLVSPEHRPEELHLSEVVDAVAADIFPGIRLQEADVVAKLEMACHFAYVPTALRQSGRDYSRLTESQPRLRNWREFASLGKEQLWDGLDAEERALRVALSQMLAEDGGAATVGTVCKGPRDLVSLVAAEKLALVDGKDGPIDARLSALQRIADRVRARSVSSGETGNGLFSAIP